jgi:alpha-beta hydrolase superfamily lysophospholipase
VIIMTMQPFPGNSPYPRELTLWEPEGKPRGIVVIAHGMAEHIARYDGLGQSLARAGLLAVGYNHLGHGKEASIPGWFSDTDGWGKLVGDLHAVLQAMAIRWPGVPRVLLGHSMGSFLTREYALRYPGELHALVLSGTGWHNRMLCQAGLLPARLACSMGFEKKASGFLDKMAFSAHNKSFKTPGGTAFDWLSRDKAEVEKYINDPLCGFVFTAGGFRDMFTGLLALTDIERLKALPADLPVYLLSGGDDPVGGKGVGVREIALQYQAAGLLRVYVKLYDGARHELFNEVNKEEVRSGLITWLSSALLF